MKKILVLGILVGFLFIGFAVGQQEQQKQGQPLPAPFIVLFGNQWFYYDEPKLIESFDELGVQLVLIKIADQNGMGGIVELISIVNVKSNMEQFIAGWIKPCSSEEQGFVLKENGDWFLTDEKKVKGEQVDWKPDYNQEGNPVMIFYLKKKGEADELIIRIFDIKKFAEELK